jgi:hypothetical protein
MSLRYAIETSAPNRFLSCRKTNGLASSLSLSVEVRVTCTKEPASVTSSRQPAASQRMHMTAIASEKPSP